MVKQDTAKALEEKEDEDEVEMGGDDGLVKENDDDDDDDAFHGLHGRRRRVGMNTMRATVMTSIRNNPKTYASVLAIVVVLVTVCLAIVVDLLLMASSTSSASSSVQEMLQVSSVSLDVSNPVPVANVELHFHATRSRLSRVEPQGMTCTLDKSGAAIIVSAAKMQDDKDRQYLLQVTCPEQDVEAHAALLWNVLTKKSTRLGKFHCSATVQVFLGHVWPVTHAVSFDFDGNDLVQAVEQMKRGDDQVEKKQETENNAGQPPAIVVRQARLNQMEIGVRLGNDEIPDFVYDMTPTLKVKLPPLTMVVQPSDSAGMNLYMDGVDAIFVKNASSFQSQELVFGIATNTESKSTPWFGPILGLYSRSQQGTTVDVSVLHQGTSDGVSFLETLIGQDHRFNVHFQQETVGGVSSSSSWLESARRRRRRRRRDVEEDDAAVMSELEQEMQKRSRAVAADCMSVDNAANETDFKFSMCWLFQLSKGLAFVGNMTLYDNFVSAVMETTWEASPSSSSETFNSTNRSNSSNIGGGNDSSSWVKVNTNALVEVGSGRDVMNVTGGARLNVADNVQLKMTLFNDGEIWPFEGALLADAAVDANTGIFTMTMSQASFNLQDELLADATGSVVVDVIQQTTEMVINDPNMQFRSTSAVAGDTTTSTTTYSLFGETVYNWVTEGRFENNETFYMSTNETVSGSYFTSLYQLVDDGLLARTAYAWNGESSMEFIVQGALLNNGDNSVVLGNSTLGWYTQDYNALIWDSNMEAKFQFDDLDIASPMSFEMELVDDVLNYRLASALAGGFTFTCITCSAIDYALEYLTFELEGEPFVNWTGRILIDLNNAPLQPELFTALNITLDIDDSALDYQVGLGSLVRIKQGQFKIVLDHLTFVLEEMQHADMNGEFKLVFNESMATLKLQDTAELDFVADFVTRWFANSSGVGGQFDNATLTVGSDLYMDIETGRILIQGPTGSLLIASNPSAKLQLGTGVDYASFAMVEWNDMIVAWDGETFLDMHGHFKLDPYGSIQLFIEDTSSSLDFTHNTTIGWETQALVNTSSLSSVQATFRMEPLLRVGSTTYFDSTVSLQVKNEVEYGQRAIDGWMEGVDMMKESLANGVFRVTSVPAAELQMGIVLNYNMSTANFLFKELKLEWDDLRLGWQDKTFFDIHGHSTLDPSSVEFFVEDSSSLDFTHNFSSRWFADSTPSGGVLWGGFLDEALLRVGSTVYLDSAGSFAWENVEWDAIGLLNFTSSPLAALQLGMGMKLNYFSAADQFRVLLDRVSLGWKDEMYFESSGTIKKTLPSSFKRKEIRFDDVSLVLAGVAELTPSETASFEKLTADWLESFFAQSEETARRRSLQDGTSSGSKIYEVESTVTVTGQDVGEKTVNGETVSVNTLTYNQTLSYMATDDAGDAREYALMPFSNDEVRSQYESTLIQNIAAFSSLQVPMETPVIKADETESTGDSTAKAADTDGGSGGLSSGALIGIVVGAVIAAVAVFVFLFWIRSKTASGKQQNEDEDLEGGAKPEMALTGQEEEEECYSGGRGEAK
jgi:hypothetical protein